MAFIGDLSGITERNKTNATYQSMIDGELMYEYAIYRFNKKRTRATFRCSGCRSAIDDGRAPEFKIYYLKGAIDSESKTVIFDEDPDEHPHCCERRNPHFVKGKQIKRHVRNEIKGSGIVGSQCLTKLNQKVKECEENGDHDGVVVPPFVRMPIHQQQFNPHFNPYFQHQNNIQQIPQQFNMSLPIYYQQPPPQQFYVQQFPPYFYNPRF